MAEDDPPSAVMRNHLYLSWLIACGLALAAVLVWAAREQGMSAAPVVLAAPLPALPSSVDEHGNPLPDDWSCRDSAECVAGYQWAVEHAINEDRLCTKGGDEFRRGCLTLRDEVKADEMRDGPDPPWWQR